MLTVLGPDTSTPRLVRTRSASRSLAPSYRSTRRQTAALYPRSCTIGPFPPFMSHPSSYGLL